MKTLELKLSDEQFRAFKSFAAFVRCTPGELILALACAQQAMDQEDPVEYTLSALEAYVDKRLVPIPAEYKGFIMGGRKPRKPELAAAR